MKKLIYILFIIPSIAFSQSNTTDSLWLRFNSFIGNWSGTGTGEPGNGNYIRLYHFIFGGTFIEIRSKATYSPTSKNPKGEVHEDVGYISYDKERKKFILRQFHVEGFVNQYVLDSISPDGKTMVFITEQIENIPAGWKAKETYRLTSANRFIETFELAENGKEYFIYTQTEFMKQK